MSEENGMQAETPAAQTTTPAEQHTPAEHHQEHYEQPAETQEQNYDEPADYDAPEHDQHEAEQPDRPKKLCGAQRAKLQRQYLENELSAREQRITG
jgi:hypothetical protein